MPRVSRRQTAQNRHAITDACATLMRERGINGVSVADLMGAAGLTHGGFYGHFDSKDAAAAAACAHAFEQSAERWRQRVANATDGPAGIQAIVEAYLSPRSRDNPGTSCPMAALVADVGREPAAAPVREAFTSGVLALVDILQKAQQDLAPDEAQLRALSQAATLVGALTLARATAGHPVADEFLTAARGSLETPRDTPTPRRRRT